VFVLTDDQDVEIGGLEPMPKLKRLVGDAGATFRFFYVNTPVCCPSRSEFLSGRYHHNIRDDKYEAKPDGTTCLGDEAVGAAHPCGCMHVNSSTAEFEGLTYANYMQQAGYLTAYFGKCESPPSLPPSYPRTRPLSLPPVSLAAALTVCPIITHMSMQT
jgi:arylsulfatase A-like enzyme